MNSPLEEIIGSDMEMPRIIPVMRQAAESYEKRAALMAPSLIGQTPHLLTDAQCACKKWMPLLQFPKYYTGRVTGVDNVCAGCRKQYAGMVRIICTVCKFPVLFVTPHKDRNGFEFVHGRTYHVTACPTCLPEVRTVIPVEKIVFDYRKSGSKLPIREFMKMLF
jgi:hypothetical protein